MKGLVILTVLILLVGGAWYALMRPSDADLVRVEEEVASALEKARGALEEVTRTLLALRAVKQNVQSLDQRLAEARGALEAQELRLEELREERPESRTARDAFLKQRRDAVREAEELARSASDLDARAKLLAEFMRETQPKVLVMRNHAHQLAGLREQLTVAGRASDPELATLLQKIDQLYQESIQTSNRARDMNGIAELDLSGLRTVERTVRNEAVRIIEDMAALRRELEKALEAVNAGG